MDGIIAIIVIVATLYKFVNRTKKVKQSAPGKAAAPMRPAAPAARPASAMPTVKPAMQPSRGNVQLPDFWQQVSNALKEELTPKKTDPGHGPVGKMSEGDSRECGHGSVGGSMAYAGHQEGVQTKPNVKQRAAAAYDRNQQNDSLYRPAMNAQEMRRAVVMAEILKRPQDRMAEQARRWNVR